MNPGKLPSLAEVVQKVRRLPPLRAIVLNVLGSLEQPQTNLVELAQGISRDVVISASALRIVNSPFYGLRTPVESVQQAAMILGTSNLRGIIAAAALVNDYALPHDGPYEAEHFWLHSFGCAVWARLLAERENQAKDLAFTAGLLHDVGKIVLAVNFGELCREIARRAQAEGQAIHIVECEMLGFDHAAVGAELLRHWRLSERLVRAVALHHTPPQHDEDRIAALVRSANQIEQQVDFGETGAKAALPAIPGMTGDEAQAMIATARGECELMRALLQRDGAAEQDT
jgi:putative nucleotidyltransferase with HDIG domain